MSTETIDTFTTTAAGFSFASNECYPSPTMAEGPASALGTMAAQAIATVLPGANLLKAESFTKSLEKNLQIKRANGFSLVEWAPLGGGTPGGTTPQVGALAAFYYRASAKLALAREELLKLEPMCEVDYLECCEDLTEVIRTKLDELECAMGSDCGPCPNWVDEIFTQLLGAEHSNEGGLMDVLEKSYTTGEIPNCPDEEQKLADISLFQAGLVGLRSEWHLFKTKFIYGKLSLSVRTMLLLNRTAVMKQNLHQIRVGLHRVGYGKAWLAVEQVDGAGSVCCLLDRLEQFVGVRAHELLEHPGQGAFAALLVESRQLMDVAGHVRGWLAALLPTIGVDPIDLKRNPVTSRQRQFVEFAESTGPIALGFRGVMFAASTFYKQMETFYDEVVAIAPQFTLHRRFQPRSPRAAAPAPAPAAPPPMPAPFPAHAPGQPKPPGRKKK